MESVDQSARITAEGKVGSVMLRAESRACLFWLRINGVPVAFDQKAKESVLHGVANQWLRPGHNTIRVDIDWPAGVSYVQGVANAIVELRAHLPKKQLPHATVTLRWPTRDEPETYPATLEATVDLPDFPPTLLWTRVEQRRDLGRAEAVRIAELVMGLQDAYQARRIDNLIAMVEPKITDLAAAYGTVPAEDLATSRKFIANLTDTPDWGLMPLSKDDISLEPVAEGRMVWVCRGNREPLLQTAPTCSRKWMLPVFVCLHEGQWKVIR
jgi:hypothetical protein